MTYDLKSYGRGVAYIFVNESYGESGDFEDRTGAHREYKYLKRMFRDLTFKIRHYKDASNEKMIEELRKACSDPKMKERSCLVCVICSHGIEKTSEAVHALDGASNDITQHYIVDGRGNEINTDNIMSIVRDCKALKNKPKLFLMQVCRENMKAKEREKYDFGVTVNAKQEMSAYNSMSTDGSSKVGVTSKGQEDYVSGSDSDTDTDDGLSDQEEFDRTDYFRKRRQKIKQQQQRQKEDEEMRQEISKKENNDKSEKTERPITETDSKAKRPSQRKIDTTVKTLGVREEKPVTVMSIPCYDDMLVMFASNSGKYGFRSSHTGGVLVSSLCHVINGYLKEHGHGCLEKIDFLSILTEVVNRQTQHRTSMEITRGSPREVTTVPVIYHKFTKDMYIPIMEPSTWIHKLKSFMKHI